MSTKKVQPTAATAPNGSPSMKGDADNDEAVGDPIAALVSCYRAISEWENWYYHNTPGSAAEVNATVLPFHRAREGIRDLLIARGHAELATALLRERDTHEVIQAAIAEGRADYIPAIDRYRAQQSTQAVDQLAATPVSPAGTDRRDD
jgi:hypothetical protein